MNGQIIKLTELANVISAELKSIVTKDNLQIKAACLCIGIDEASESYIRGMQKQAEKLEVTLDRINFDQNISETAFLKELNEINKQDCYSGIIIQMPIPKHIGYSKIQENIDPYKDSDGINYYNQGRLFSGNPFLIPATAWAVDLSLAYIEKNFDFQLSGKNAIVLGRSTTVGKPSSFLMLQRNITPTITHTKTLKTNELSSKADIIIACCGKPLIVKSDWVKENSVIIDVGIHSIETDDDKKYKLCGDVDADDSISIAKIITAVPGGIGPVTSVLLYANVIKGYYKIHKNTELKFDFEN